MHFNYSWTLTLEPKVKSWYIESEILFPNGLDGKNAFTCKPSDFHNTGQKCSTNPGLTNKQS